MRISAYQFPPRENGGEKHDFQEKIMVCAGTAGDCRAAARLFLCGHQHLRRDLHCEPHLYLSRGDKHPKPAMWQPSFSSSLFGTEEDALRELRADPRTRGWTISSK